MCVHNFRLSLIHGTRNKGLCQVKPATDHLGQEGPVREVSVRGSDGLVSVPRDPRQALMTMRPFQRGWAWEWSIQWARPTRWGADSGWGVASVLWMEKMILRRSLVMVASI
jgi:hypothetical protein